MLSRLVLDSVVIFLKPKSIHFNHGTVYGFLLNNSKWFVVVLYFYMSAIYEGVEYF